MFYFDKMIYSLSPAVFIQSLLLDSEDPLNDSNSILQGTADCEEKQLFDWVMNVDIDGLTSTVIHADTKKYVFQGTNSTLFEEIDFMKYIELIERNDAVVIVRRNCENNAKVSLR